MNDRGNGRRADGWLCAFLLLGLGLRLVWLDQPLIDQQAWRQADTAAIARNYFEEGYDLLYPRVDWRGAGEGYVEMNFPLFSFAAACLYKVVGGVHEWLGRLLSALFSTAAAGLLYALSLRLYGDRWAARWAALFFLVAPMSLFFGRAFMPEALMLLLSAAALLAFDRWGETRRGADFLLAVATAALCFLVKIPTLYLGFPLVALAWSRWGWAFLRRPALWLYLVLVLLPSLLWYWHAAGLFARTGLTFGIWSRYGYDKWDNVLLLDPGFYLLMAERLGLKVLTPAVGVLAMLGLARRPRERRQWMPRVWVAGLLLYVLLIPEGNRRLHYYQLPFALPGALLAGWALADLARGKGWPHLAGRARAGLVAGVLALTLAGGAWAVLPYYEPPNNLYQYYQGCHLAGQIVDRLLPKDALLVIGDVDENAGTPLRAQSPTLLYYCHRKGWQITPQEFSGARLDSLAALGGDYFLAAGGFVMQDEVFWRELLRRGATIPAEYPRFYNDEKAFHRALAGHRGPDRHFVLVRLRNVD